MEETQVRGKEEGCFGISRRSEERKGYVRTQRSLRQAVGSIVTHSHIRTPDLGSTSTETTLSNSSVSLSSRGMVGTSRELRSQGVGNLTPYRRTPSPFTGVFRCPFLPYPLDRRPRRVPLPPTTGRGPFSLLLGCLLPRSGGGTGRGWVDIKTHLLSLSPFTTELSTTLGLSDSQLVLHRLKES